MVYCILLMDNILMEYGMMMLYMVKEYFLQWIKDKLMVFG